MARKSKREPASRPAEAPANGSQSYVAMLIGIVLVLGGIAWAWQQVSVREGIDFYQFWIGGRVAPHEANIYSIEARQRIGGEFYGRSLDSGSQRMTRVAEARKTLELYSTPFLYTCFALLPRSYDAAYLTYGAISIAALLAGIALLGRAAGWTWPPILFVAAFVLFLFQPLKSELRVANVNDLQLVMIAGYMFMARRNAIASGVILAIAMAFKPNLVLVLPLVVVARLASREHRELVRELSGAVAGGIGAVMISSLWFRSFAAWTNWLAAARNLSQGIFARNEGNVAPVLTIVQSFGSGVAFAVAAGLTAIAGFALWRGKGSAAAAAAIGSVIYLLTAPLVWFHYLLLAVPLAVWTMRARSLPLQVAAVVALTLIGADAWEALLPIRTYSGEAALVGIGLVLLFATSVLALHLRVMPASDGELR